MKASNVILPSWKDVMAYESKINVGPVEGIHVSSCECLGFKTELKDTLQRIVSTPLLFDLFEFMPEEKQSSLFTFLKERNEELYGKLDKRNKTLFLRITGTRIKMILTEELLINYSPLPQL